MRNLLVGSLVAVTLGVLFVTVGAQQPSRLFGTQAVNLATGVSTPITCTQSGAGCTLDVAVAGGVVGYTNLIQVDANTLAERNGTNAQTFDFYKSYTDANTYQRLRIAQDGTFGGWSIEDQRLIAGSPSAAGTQIQMTAKQLQLVGENGSIVRLDGHGVRFGPGLVMYHAVDTAYRIQGARSQHGKECWSTSTATPDSTTPRSLCIAQFEAGVLAVYNDDNVSPPATGGSGTIMIGDPGTKPTCDVTRRGMFWHDFGGAGAKDTVEICAKDAANAYAWRALY